ncbi:helicase-related protein [Verrucomicrobium spinosum]|uniref:helicase-related protein n=1 Tax=Verrucomicrobium spinosum TaxID=2736 RepID=UPI0031B5F5A4
MPDHVHALLEPLPESWDDEGNATFHSLGGITHSIKSFTANEINKLEKSTDPVWEKESYDRLIRSESDLQEKFTYIVTNPTRSGAVADNEPYPWLWTPDDIPQDAECSTLEACAPQIPAADRGPDIVIGTHALLYERSAGNLPRLGLVVIDEQHKFGVAQRARLIAQGEAPDVLVMTATPIPRTLTLTLYGDLDVSTIDQRPKERGKIITAVREVTKVEEVTKFVLTRLEEGRQCYIVYPLIEESEKLDAGAATTGLEEWTKRLAPHATGLLHGRMDTEAKEAVMRQFREGSVKVLVSTTVIEVGVDVPNATVMIIHDSGRFGLAQLHQLRGRIGRGAHTSYAILFVPKGDKEAMARLKLLEETTDGFKIAEEDLARRGPGDVLGSARAASPRCASARCSPTPAWSQRLAVWLSAPSRETPNSSTRSMPTCARWSARRSLARAPCSNPPFHHRSQVPELRKKSNIPGPSPSKKNIPGPSLPTWLPYLSETCSNNSAASFLSSSSFSPPPGCIGSGRHVRVVRACSTTFRPTPPLPRSLPAPPLHD